MVNDWNKLGLGRHVVTQQRIKNALKMPRTINYIEGIQNALKTSVTMIILIFGPL